MAFALELSALQASRRWKVKIQDDERNEEPHVTILWKLKKWRVSLRTWQFLDKEPSPREVPGDLFEEIRAHEAELIEAWDRIYGDVNPVWTVDEEEDDEDA